MPDCESAAILMKESLLYNKFHIFLPFNMWTISTHIKNNICQKVSASDEKDKTEITRTENRCLSALLLTQPSVTTLNVTQLQRLLPLITQRAPFTSHFDNENTWGGRAGVVWLCGSNTAWLGANSYKWEPHSLLQSQLDPYGLNTTSRGLQPGALS